MTSLPANAKHPIEYLNEQARCPVCESRHFYMGPEGGGAVNIRCAQCKTCYWFGPPFTPQVINDVGDVGDWTYTYRAPVNLWEEAYGMVVPSPAWTKRDGSAEDVRALVVQSEG